MKDMNVPSKTNKQKNFGKKFLHLEIHWRKEQDPEQDPDPTSYILKFSDEKSRIRIRKSVVGFRGSWSVPKRQGSGTLFLIFMLSSESLADQCRQKCGTGECQKTLFC